MDERLRALEAAAAQDPDNFEKLEALAALCQRSGQRFEDRRLEEWVAFLTADPCLPNLAFWAGEANPARSLEPIWLRLVPGLLSVAEDPARPSPERCRALMALHPLGRRARAAARVLIALTRDPDDEVRVHAARILGRCGSAIPGGFEALRPTLNDPSPRVRRFAPEAWFGAAETAGQVIESLEALLSRPGFSFNSLDPGIFGLDSELRRSVITEALLEALPGLKGSSYASVLGLIFDYELLEANTIFSVFERERASELGWERYKLPAFLFQFGARMDHPAFRRVILEALGDDRYDVVRAALGALAGGSHSDDAELEDAVVELLRRRDERFLFEATLVATRQWPEREEVLSAVYDACFENPERTPRQRRHMLMTQWPGIYQTLTRNPGSRSPRIEAWARRFFPEPYG